MFFIYEMCQKIILYILKIFYFFIKDKKFRRFVYLRDSEIFLKKIKDLKVESGKEIYWFHVASAGEMEQAIPVARKLSKDLNVQFFVTYYSPSAEPFLKNFPNIIVALGLPIDIRKIYIYAIKKMNIKKIFFVRYDIWPSLFYVSKMNYLQINLLSASEKKTKNGIFGYFSAKWNKKYYKNIDNIFAVSKEDFKYFSKINANSNVYLAGDAKWARAFERANSLSEKKLEYDFSCFFSFCLDQKKLMQKKCIVFGSPHKEEHHISILLTSLLNEYFIIYVPHDVKEESCGKIKKEFEEKNCKVIFYSEIVKFLKSNLIEENNTNFNLKYDLEMDKNYQINKNYNVYNLKYNAHYLADFLSQYEVIIFDKIGYLAEIYEVADVAIIGGGFDGQIHNVLEAAAHAVPVLLGNSFHRAREAADLVNSEAAISFQNPNEMFQFLVQWVSLKEKGSDSTQHPSIRLSQARTKTIELFKSIPDTSEIILNTLLQQGVKKRNL
ncbi:glycosyltransferase N-terminal domain-containing protein [Pigmentibacter sp. JX0631]|uniref:3-deoxy-D-manno-octulosonic acid transferase n=1 Tax=Pigmentibacter sp. JX0631 TaxID=2976982 RepID=UPI002468C6BB|nr:glycosyltransferase N-terminal domain-containing protein [Pigmentibacter sp. JX0631]WGL61402.1 glycosyltransferase N-terminal domain-containing protein [Pigmentibacter sp. JX0631]